MSTPQPRRPPSATSAAAPPSPREGNPNKGPENEHIEERQHPPHPIYHHPGPPPHEHHYLMPGEYPYPPHPMMGMHPDHYGMPPMMPPMHPSDMNDLPHHHHHHHHMMSEFPQPPPPARFMPPRSRVMRQPPRVPNRIIVESNFDPRRNNEMDDMPKRKERAPSSSSFPTKLYKILADPQYREYIAWLPHGRAWRVLKPKAFEEDVIPKFFRSERYASFMRQVNGWGFKRITEGPDLNSYYHEMFLRGLPQVCAKMRRPQKGQGASQNKDALGQAPDFYKISMFAPLPPLEDEEAVLAAHPPKTPERNESVPVSSPEVSKVSSSKTEPNKISSTDSCKDDDDEEDEDDDKPKVTPSRPDTKAPQTPIKASPTYTPMAPSPQYGSTLSPTDMGREFVELPNSAGNSVTSWTNSPSEEDMMFGNLSNAFSPYPDHQHHQYFNNHLRGRQPPSPLPSFPQSEGCHSSRPGIHPRNYDVHNSPPHMGDHPDGLSDADLSYLTFQNRILLSQANRNSGKKPSGKTS